jgi:hypothetical protein
MSKLKDNWSRPANVALAIGLFIVSPLWCLIYYAQALAEVWSELWRVIVPKPDPYDEIAARFRERTRQIEELRRAAERGGDDDAR